MKRLKVQKQKTDVIKRQKSQTEDSKFARDNLQQNSQVVPESLQQDSPLANHNLQQDGHKNNGDGEEVSSVKDNFQTLPEDKNSIETDAEKVKEVVDDAKCVCRIPDSFKSNCNENQRKLPPGFGFTKGTSQYRTPDNCKQLENTGSSRRRLKGQYVEKNVRQKNAGITCAAGNTNDYKSSLNLKGAIYKIPISTSNEALVPKNKNKDTNMNDSKSENKLRFIQTGRIFKTQQLSTREIEMDVIYTEQLQEKRLEQAPEQAPVDYVDMSTTNLPTQSKMTCLCMVLIGKRKPDEESNILIPHKNADKPEGDDFGAKLWTFIEKRQDGSVYYRHFLMDVQPAGLAGQMGIENNDELVLVGYLFVPPITHIDVLNLFHHVQVDGKTRFVLVVRRVENKKWDWIETSAILTADKSPDESPAIEHPEYKTFEGERYEVPKSQYLYKVPGTQKYLDISDRKICVDTLQHNSTDKTKVIWKRCIYWPTDKEEHIDFAAALCDETMKWYIGIDSRTNDIILKDKPEWFKMITLGSNVRFQFQDQYLGYDRESGQVKAQTSNCVFEELPASKLQVLESHTGSEAMESVPEDSGNVSETTSSNLLESGCVAPNDACDNSEISSSHSSVDSFNSSQISNYAERNAGELNDEAGSSGYGSRSLTPPGSFDDPDCSGIDSQCGSNTHPKTPTTPMTDLSLSEKVPLTSMII